MSISLRRTTRAVLAAVALGAGLAAADEPPATPDAPPLVTASGKDGFTIQSEDGSFKLRIGGYAQGDEHHRQHGQRRAGVLRKVPAGDQPGHESRRRAGGQHEEDRGEHGRADH